MPRIADRIQETSTTSGTGNLTLAGASAGFKTFSSAFAVGDGVYYCVVDGTNWEVGIGTMATTSSISRDAVLASSNAGARVSFSASSKTVFCTLPAQAVHAAALGRQVALVNRMALP